MAVAKKKAPAKKQKAPATKIARVRVKVMSKIKVKPKKKTRVEVKAKRKAKTIKAPAKASAKKKAPSTKKAKSEIKLKAKPKKTVALFLKKKTVAQKPEKKTLKASESAVPKKGTTAVAPAADRFRGLKGKLIAKRDALLDEAKQEIQKYVSGENRQLVDTAIDEADWAAVEISEDINLKRLSAQRQLLNDVEECLRKINEGTYGICEDCGEEISEKRLHVIPTATLCIDCKEQREKMAILDLDTEI